MTKRVIVDVGATNADWVVSGGKTIRTEGFNLAHTPREKLEIILDGAAAKIGPGVTELHFFAAGLVGESPVDLGRWFPSADIEYASDMVAAARALFGKGKGIAAILGTGANTCLWDGEKISAKIPSGGFILGDDGSASVLGRLFVADWLKGLVPAEIARAFEAQFGADYPTVVKRVYGGEAPARYLGSFAPFILDHYADPYIKELVDNNFRRFFQRTVLPYGHWPLGICGGFGWAYREIIGRIGGECGVEISAIIKSPLEGLAKYYGI